MRDVRKIPGFDGFDKPLTAQNKSVPQIFTELSLLFRIVL
jgi:hypothetical protein